VPRLHRAIFILQEKTVPRLHRAIFILLIVSLVGFGGLFNADAAFRAPTVKIFVDTDIGVDDAAAIAWLLRAPSANVVGFTTVAGNTTVENATQNLLTLLDVAGRQIPVTMGAAVPSVYPRSHVGMFVHGPSGLWFSQVPHDLSNISHNAPAAIAAAARANPGMTLIALGPLTNVAEAARQFPSDMASAHIIVLAGSRGPGNRTPVAEFNAFGDPQALDIVLESQLDVTLVTLDAFNQVEVDSTKFPQELTKKGDALGQFLASALTPYFLASTQGAGGPAAIPDAAAVIYALRPELGTATSALVDVATDAGLTRGQTVIATDANSKIAMIADDAELSALADRAFSDPNFDINAALGQILMRRPDNAKVVLTVDGKEMARTLERGLTQH
jgi:inosine-uridine nucleoside N-ribohydrolase